MEAHIKYCSQKINPVFGSQPVGFEQNPFRLNIRREGSFKIKEEIFQKNQNPCVCNIEATQTLIKIAHSWSN